MKTSIILLVMLAAVIMCCQPPAPTGLSTADLEAIQKVTNDAVAMASGTADWTAYTDLYYAPDATVLPPNMEAVKGREAIISNFASMSPVSDMQFTQVKVDGCGDLAYVYGEYSMSVDVGGEMVPDNGKYIEIWKRQADGSWQVIYDIYNSDLPLPDLAPAEEAE
ncbi:MAG: YybH family protein [Anaerolineales bacterium]